MPYRSEKQRRFMHARHPEIAARWDAEYGGTIQPNGNSKQEAYRRALKKRLGD